MKNLTSKQAKLLKQFALEVSRKNGWRCWPNYYTGSGSWSRCSADYANEIHNVLIKLGMVRGKHFRTGNDAPRGGWTGDFVELLPAGKRWKIIKELRAAAAAEAEAAALMWDAVEYAREVAAENAAEDSENFIPSVSPFKT